MQLHILIFKIDNVVLGLAHQIVLICCKSGKAQNHMQWEIWMHLQLFWEVLWVNLTTIRIMELFNKNLVQFAYLDFFFYLFVERER